MNRIVKSFSLFLMVLCFSTLNANPNLINIGEGTMGRREALLMIASQAKATIDFGGFEKSESIEINLKNADLTTALGQVLKKTGYTYKLSNNKITLIAGNKNSLSGKVTDAITGEALPLVSVLADAKNSTVANLNGTYDLKLPKGKHVIKYSFVGYAPLELIVDVTNVMPVIDVALKADNTLDAVTVTSSRDDKVKNTSMGVEKLDIIEIKRVPALMGEVDVLKVIQLLPGVQPTAEGGSGFSVRGSSPDQNLIMLDNVTIYNASHIMGFFSVFNNDVVKGIDLYKGDLPLKYGGRLASVLDVTTIENKPERFSGTGGVGLISSRLMLQSPIGKKTDVMVSGRRSYADLFLGLSSDEALKNSTMYFYDANLKINHTISDKDKISVSGYYGMDRFKTDISKFDYGNGAASAIWRHTYNEKLFSKINLNISNYNYSVGSTTDELSVDWVSNIFDVQLRADFNYNLNANNALTFGVSSTYHKFNPGDISGTSNISYKIDPNYSIESSAYLSNEQKLGDRLTLRYGLRWTMFQNLGPGSVYKYSGDKILDTTEYPSGKIYHTYYEWEPRAALAFRLNDVSSIKGNYARNAQFIQLANNSASGSPLNIWFSAGPNVKPQTVDNFSAGYFRNISNNSIEFSTEVYYKKLNNVIDFKDHAKLLMNKYIDQEILVGKGDAYGIEFMVKKNTGKLTGFANYTLSRSERKVSGINNDKTYLAPYDKTHVVNISANYEFTRKWSVSANWIYATGNPTTYPSGRFEVEGEYLPIYSSRNKDRLPDYHRLDLSVNFIPKPNSTKRFKGEWNLSVYNAYAKKNPWLVNLKQDDNGKAYGEMVYLFGIVPSITYNFKF